MTSIEPHTTGATDPAPEKVRPTWREWVSSATVKQVMSSRLRPLRRLAPLAVLPFVIAACADDKPLNTFEPRGPQAESIDNLMQPIWPIMGVIFVLVVGGAIWIALRNRVKPEDFDYEDLPEQVHGNTTLELTWTILPTILLAGISVFMVQQIWNLEVENDPDELDVMVIGQQWWWEYRYDVDGDGFIQDGNGDGEVDDRDWELPLELILDPDDVVTANELVIPEGQQVDLRLTSRDVIHSFWIPRLNGKRDTVPGRWHTWSLEAFEAGKYTGWCTEYCGLSHARMRMSTIALPQEEFDQWLANQATLADVPTEGDALAGYEIFQQQCVSCHIVRDGNLEYENYDPPLIPGAAPDLTHFAPAPPSLVVSTTSTWAQALRPQTMPSTCRSISSCRRSPRTPRLATTFAGTPLN